MRQKNTLPDAIYLITYPRTGSNLLLKILNLSEQPQVAAQTKEGYYFHPPLKLRNELSMFDRPLALWGQDCSQLLSECFQDCFAELDNDLRFANAVGKTLFVKEHAPWLIDPTRQSKWIHGPHDNYETHSTPSPWQIEYLGATGLMDLPMEMMPNPTILPSEFLRQVSPTFLIRNPILSFPSHYRAMRDSWYGSADTFQETGKCYLKFNMTIRWSRMMYDWYEKQLNHEHDTHKRPIVLDADDIMTAPEVLIQYCNFVGLDPSKLKFSWKPMEKEKLGNVDPEFLRMKDTLHASDGVRQDKVAAGLVLAKEAVKWRNEFGDTEAAKLVKWVQAAMPDYEYMWARRLTLPN
ncbi:hypothetical protein N7507_009533 [Penicillium longicatenatum]|nr:hypothetical protein N7507_009533 [Penicillium longicatenatum]